jgi:succinate dehydrogenase / fumarate reductase flavoprotein subunit
MIRTLQDHGVHRGIDVHMEVCVLTLLKDGERVVGAFGYDRERGQFKAFHAKAVVLATGGVGKAYKITSNSWDCTGDGHALAYHAGAALIDMEYLQFHPTGMVWPPSVCGMLVTEGVRGEGGVLTNKDGKRFMFDFIPDNYKAQTADNEEEGWRYTQGDKNARRPPDLLTRDHVARCIVREIKEGRGSPHGGVFLDISWIKKKIPNAEEHIKRKLPSMYHQFKKLGDVDITREPMESARRRIISWAESASMRTRRLPSVPGCCRWRMCRRHQWRQPARRQFAFRPIVFGKRAANSPRNTAKENKPSQINSAQIEEASRAALEPFNRNVATAQASKGTHQVQYDLQEMMQNLVGIVRREDECSARLDGLSACGERARRVSVTGHRSSIGWHGARPHELLTVSECITRAALERKESRGARYPGRPAGQGSGVRQSQHVWRRGSDGAMQVRRDHASGNAGGFERSLKNR